MHFRLAPRSVEQLTLFSGGRIVLLRTPLMMEGMKILIHFLQHSIFALELLLASYARMIKSTTNTIVLTHITDSRWFLMSRCFDSGELASLVDQIE